MPAPGILAIQHPYEVWQASAVMHSASRKFVDQDRRVAPHTCLLIIEQLDRPIQAGGVIDLPLRQGAKGTAGVLQCPYII